jgi:hypothetical protein
MRSLNMAAGFGGTVRAGLRRIVQGFARGYGSLALAGIVHHLFSRLRQTLRFGSL